LNYGLTEGLYRTSNLTTNNFKNMDKLKNFIDENKAEFEMFTAPDSLWADISKQLQQPEKEEVKKAKPAKTVKMYAISRPAMMRVAASIILLLTIGIGWITYKIDALGDVAKNNPQLSKTEQHYDEVFHAKLTELKQYEQDDLYDPDLLTDIQELERIYDELRNDLKEDANNEQVVEAMVRNYRIRIELLERMLDEIKTKKNPKQDEKDNNEIREHI